MRIVTNHVFTRWIFSSFLLLSVFSFSSPASEHLNATPSNLKGQLISVSRLNEKVASYSEWRPPAKFFAPPKLSHASLSQLNSDALVKYLDNKKLITSFANVNPSLPLIYAPRSIVELPNTQQG